jgi:hypothetical protein
VTFISFRNQINHLCKMILYVRQNEETSCLKIVHFYNAEDGVPSEMEANAKSQFSFCLDIVLLTRCSISSLRRRISRDHYRPCSYINLSFQPLGRDTDVFCSLDKILVQSEFTPSSVAALSHRLQIPCSLIFMSCPSVHSPFSIADFGTRIIGL